MERSHPLVAHNASDCKKHKPHTNAHVHQPNMRARWCLRKVAGRSCSIPYSMIPGRPIVPPASAQGSKVTSVPIETPHRAHD